MNESGAVMARARMVAEAVANMVVAAVQVMARVKAARVPAGL